MVDAVHPPTWWLRWCCLLSSRFTSPSQIISVFLLCINFSTYCASSAFECGFKLWPNGRCGVGDASLSLPERSSLSRSYESLLRSGGGKLLLAITVNPAFFHAAAGEGAEAPLSALSRRERKAVIYEGAAKAILGYGAGEGSQWVSVGASATTLRGATSQKTCAPPRGHISSHREASIAPQVRHNHVAQEEAGVGFSHHAAVFPPPLRNAASYNSRHNCRRVCNPQRARRGGIAARQWRALLLCQHV